MALGKSLPLSGALFPQLPNVTLRGGRGQVVGEVSPSLSFCLPQILQAKSAQGGVVFASPGRADAVKGKCAWGRLSWPSRSFNGGSEAPYVAFNFFFLVAPCDKVSPLFQSLLFFRT